MNPADLNVVFRNEHKYLCTHTDQEILKSRVSCVMDKDPHAGKTGCYQIRSIYFDDPSDTCMRENEDGEYIRDKWRIRAYNLDPSRITLECKHKQGDRSVKTSCLISRAEYDDLIKARPVPLSDRSILNRFTLLQQTAMYRPKVIVEYTRYPYICSLGNVRVTFDLNISSSPDIDRFWEPDIRRRPVLPTGQDLMEVKFDEYLPDHIYHAIQMTDMSRLSFSKYYLCRRYTL